MTAAPMTDALRRRLCFDSLVGLSVGDALGAEYFSGSNTPDDLAAGVLPDGTWCWTDDTDMACTVAAELAEHGEIDQDRIARAFSLGDPYRGYGPGAVQVLHLIRDGVPWDQAATAVFRGGSYGNGAAMRAAPLGAYFADDYDRAAGQAIAASEVTHAHPEGIVGGVAVAVAAAFAARSRHRGQTPDPPDLFGVVGPYLVPGATARGIGEAEDLLGVSAHQAASMLGNGSRVSSQDTVPFTLWVAATHLTDYPTAVRTCIEAGGDVDTTSAIVGGIVAAFTGVGDRGTLVGVPEDWLARREPLPPRVSRLAEGA